MSTGGTTNKPLRYGGVFLLKNKKVVLSFSFK